MKSGLRVQEADHCSSVVLREKGDYNMKFNAIALLLTHTVVLPVGNTYLLFQSLEEKIYPKAIFNKGEV